MRIVPTLGQMVHRILGPERSMALQRIRRVVQTTDGCLWIGTETALLRFDGRQLRPFPLPVSPGAPEPPFITAMCAGDRQDLWVGTDQGLLHLHQGTFRCFTEGEGLPSRSILDLRLGPDLGLWVWTTGGLAGWQGSGFRAFPMAAQTSYATAPSLRFEASGQLWVCTSEGLRTFMGGRWSVPPLPSLPPGQVPVATTRVLGALWVGTNQGLFKLEGERWVQVQHGDAPLGGVTCLTTGPEGGLWIGTRDRGLFRLVPARWIGAVAGPNLHRHQGLLEGGGWLECFSLAEGLPHRAVQDLLLDREGTLWIATNNGLSRLHQGRALGWPLTWNAQARSANLRTICTDRKGTFWVGGEAGLFRLDRGTLHQECLPEQRSSPHPGVHTLESRVEARFNVRCLWPDERGHLKARIGWLGKVRHWSANPHFVAPIACPDF